MKNFTRHGSEEQKKINMKKKYKRKEKALGYREKMKQTQYN